MAGLFASPRARRASLMALVALALVVMIQGYRRFHVPQAQAELVRYFRDIFPALHDQTRSIQAGIAGLVEGSGARRPVAVLDENVLPSVEAVIVQARSVTPSALEVRALHDGYVQALEGMREDVVALRVLYADEGLPAASRDAEAARVVSRLTDRFERYYARAREIWAENEIAH